MVLKNTAYCDFIWQVLTNSEIFLTRLLSIPWRHEVHSEDHSERLQGDRPMSWNPESWWHVPPKCQHVQSVLMHQLCLVFVFFRGVVSNVHITHIIHTKTHSYINEKMTVESQRPSCAVLHLFKLNKWARLASMCMQCDKSKQDCTII